MTDGATARGGGRVGRRLAGTVLPVLAAFLLLAVASGCSARDAMTTTPEAVAAVTYSETAPVKSGLMSPMEDWHHLRQVLGYLKVNRPKRPPVYLLGGSSTRECTINDLSWRRQIAAFGGPRVWAFNLGSSNQSFDHEIEMIRQLPDVPSIVIIGINLGRYCWKPPTDWGVKKMVLKDEGSVIKPYAQHRFVYNHIAADSKKREMAYQWIDERGPQFNEYFRYNAGRLAALVSFCKQRGFHPVILNMPWNKVIVGHLHDSYRDRMARNAENVAARYNVPYIDWIPAMNLVSRDFMDNAHLVEPGRVKYQRRLSLLLVRLCHRYGISVVPRPTASPTPSSTTSPAESPTPSSSSTVAP
jgi:hypothetical protein